MSRQTRTIQTVVAAAKIAPLRAFGRKRSALLRKRTATAGQWAAWLRDMEGDTIDELTDEVMSRMGYGFNEADGCWENEGVQDEVWEQVIALLAARCLNNN